MTAQPALKLSPQEYLAIERQRDSKSEYVNGELFAMAGASRWHNLIVTNVLREVSRQLKTQPCEVYPSDMRVWIPRLKKYTYPDVVVVYGPPRFEDNHHDTLLNPILIIEVLSPSTAEYDRGVKFKHYRTLDTLQEYLLISQDVPLIERYVRQETTRFWTLSDAEGMEGQVELSSIGSVELSLAEVYDKISFQEAILPNSENF